MKVLVCGSRSFTDYGLLKRTLNDYEGRISTIIHGLANGADRMGGAFAEENRIDVLEFPAEWELHGKRAGPIRNARMLKEGQPDLVVAFWDGKSRGTENMIKQARDAGVPVRIAFKRPEKPAGEF